MEQRAPKKRIPEEVMERRNLLLGLVVLALSLFLLPAAAALARTAHHSAKHARKAVAPAGEECVVHTLPGSFMDMGESLRGGPDNASSVVDIVEVECNPEYAGARVIVADQELEARCADGIEWMIPPSDIPSFGAEARAATLDNDGNALFVVFGSRCAKGETLVTADLEAGKHPTAITTFSVEPPKPTTEGVFVFPSVEHPLLAGEGAVMENADNSSMAAIITVEFNPEFAEEFVNISDRQLLAKCKFGKKVTFYGPHQLELAEEEPSATVQLDNDGNAFVVVVGGESCQAGKTLVEASLEAAPYTTFYTDLTILPPEPTI